MSPYFYSLQMIVTGGRDIAEFALWAGRFGKAWPGFWLYLGETLGGLRYEENA